MHDPALPIRSPPELGVPVGLSSDERLAKLVSNGSARAFGLLYRRHHQALYRYCCAIVRNADDAQDALQSAMLRALVALQAEQRDLAVRPWLFRIAHNEAVSLLRRRRVAVPLAGELEPSEAAAEHTWEIRERIATLVVDLQALTERQRSALVMHELSGLPIKEIAVALSISPGAAKQALFEARCALQEFDEGRAMDCEAVRRVVSDGDRRVLHGRKIRGHLRSCQGCRDFRRTIGERQAAWSALAPPLPAAAASAMLARLLAQAVDGGHVGGAAAASGIAVGKPGAASVAAKVLACAAVVTVTATGGARLVLQPSHHPHAKPPAPAAGRSSGVSLAAGTLPGRQSSGSVIPTPARGTTRETGDLHEWRERGEATCKRVYGAAYERLRQNIRALHPLLDEWMVVDGYGKVLSCDVLAPAPGTPCRRPAPLATADTGEPRQGAAGSSQQTKLRNGPSA